MREKGFLIFGIRLDLCPCPSIYLEESLAMNSSLVMGELNMPYVPSAAAFWASMEVAPVQSFRVMTLKPFSYAVLKSVTQILLDQPLFIVRRIYTNLIVDSTQQLVRNPPRATVSMPFLTRISSRSVLGKASRPFLPLTTTSPSLGAMASQMAAFHDPVKSMKLQTNLLESP